MKYCKFFLLIAVSAIFEGISAQNVMYQWRTHLAYDNVSQIAMTKDKVYAISDGSLFSVQKSDKHIETLSKINGLNDNNIVFTAYSQENGQLLIAYENGNIDFIDDYGSILNFPDIYRANLNAEKRVNDVLFVGNYAYLSYPFGIVKLYLKNMEVADTYFIGENGSFVDVKSVSILDGYFYAVTPDKIYRAQTSGVNLLNFANWSVLSSIPAGVNSKAISYNSKLYLLQADGKVHIFNSDFWQNDMYSNATNICANDNVMLFISDKKIDYLRGAATAFQTITFDFSIKTAIYDNGQTRIWLAAGGRGVVLSNLTATEVQGFAPNGPATNNCWKLKYAHDRIYGVPGGRANPLSPYNTGDDMDGHIMIFEDNNWKNINKWTITGKVGGNGLDLLDIEIDKNDKTHFYAASYQSGIYEFRNDQPFMLYNSANSGVQTLFPSQGPSSIYHRVDALYMDNNSRLWFTESQLQYYINTEATIKYLETDPDGTGPLLSQVKNVFYSNTKDCLAPVQIIPSPLNENLKFMLNVRREDTSGIFVFDDKGTSDSTDDEYKLLTTFIDQKDKLFNHNSSNNMCAAQDKKNNTIWVGGTFGVMILNNLQNIFNSNYRVYRVIIPRNDGSGLADYLLNDELVKSIAIDANNRKWLGTKSSGVFLMSDDGTQNIYHFTAENSPLLSNNIVSIAINNKTGEVFFGTSKGIISFQSDSTDPPRPPFHELHAYPNPVRPEHIAKGIPITIIGLAENAVVKITDTAGNLVYETISKGGMVV